MAKGYLTDQEIYEIECAIYNDDDKALLQALPEGIEDFNTGGAVKELAEGQEYYIVPQTNLMIRQDGRIYNVKHVRTIKPLWTPKDIILNANGKQIRYSTIYKSQGWKFKQEDICKTYADKNWGISVTHGYKETFDKLYR